MKRLLLLAALAAACTKSPAPQASQPKPTPFRPVPARQTNVVWDDKAKEYVPAVVLLPQGPVYPAKVSKPRSEKNPDRFFLTVTAHHGGMTLSREVAVTEREWLKFSLRTTACVGEGFFTGEDGIEDCR